MRQRLALSSWALAPAGPSIALADSLLHRWRGIRNRRRKRAGVLRKRLAKLNASLAKLNATIRRRRARLDGGDGADAVRWLLAMAGQTESPPGSNDAPFLAEWRRWFPTLAWMRGQPWCGFACIAAWYKGADKRLPDGTVYTPNIVTWAHAGTHFKAIAASQAKPGDLVVFDWSPGTGADHVALALGPAVNGLIPTIEGNTSATNAGSQSNGGGIFKRSRPVGLVAVVARPL